MAHELSVSIWTVIPADSNRGWQSGSEISSYHCPGQPELDSFGTVSAHRTSAWELSHWRARDVVQLLSHVRLLMTPWTAARQASLSFTISQFTQMHVHWVRDAIQPSYPLLSFSPPAFSLSQHRGLFQWVGSFPMSRLFAREWMFIH